MTSKHSIMLGTDGPDSELGSNGGGGKFITPSAHVLAATRPSAHASSSSSSTSSGTQHSADAEVGDIFITPRVPAAVVSSSFGFGDGDVSTEELLPSSRDSVASRLPFNQSAPRTLISSSSTAAFSSPTLAPTSTSSGVINPAVSQSMSNLSATFASLMAGNGGGDSGKYDDEDDRKDIEGLMLSLQNGSIAKAATATATTPEPPSKLSTCFDLVTSTATRIPLSTIIAASASIVAPANSNGNGIVRGGGSSSFAIDSFVVIEPIDWSRHHHDSTFARLTAINTGADQVDEIAMEIEAQRLELEQQLQKERKSMQEKDRIIASQKAQIEELQRQLKDMQASNGLASTPSHPTVASASTSTAAASSRAVPDSGSEEEEDEEEDNDIDQGMADEEDAGFSKR